MSIPVRSESATEPVSPISRSAGPLPPALFGLALLAQVALHWLLPIATAVHGSWRALGLIPLAVALTVNARESRAFERLATPIHPFARPATLRTDGCYRWTRNPMYLGMLLGLVGAAVLLGTVSPWLLVPTLGIVLDRRFIQREEAALGAEFGVEYDAYRRRVRRWL